MTTVKKAKKTIPVVHLTDGLTRGGGIEVTLTQALARLGRTRYRIHVAVLERKPNDLGGQLLSAGVPLHDLGAPWFRTFWATLRLARLVRREGIALVHANNPACILVALRVKRFVPALRVVGHLRGLLSLGVDGDPRRSRVRRARRRLEQLRRTAGFLDRILCVSDAVRRSVEEELGLVAPLVEVVHNGRDLAPFRRYRDVEDRASSRRRLGFPSMGPLVTLVARLGSEKDFDTFLRAVCHVRAAIASARFVIVGEGRQRPMIEARIAELGLREAVTLTGYRSDIPEIMGATDVFCLTSTSESFGNVLVEAMAAGVPCVSTDCGGPADIITDGVDGYLVPVGDAEAVARAIVSILDDPEKMARMRAAAARKSEDFSIDAMVEGWVRVYDEALDLGAGASAAAPVV